MSNMLLVPVQKCYVNDIGVNHPVIVREIPHFDVFPAFLLERPAFLAEFREEKII